jgi:hypothetical protein
LLTNQIRALFKLARVGVCAQSQPNQAIGPKSLDLLRVMGSGDETSINFAFAFLSLVSLTLGAHVPKGLQ